MADLNNPRFWQQLYAPPADSQAHQMNSIQTLEIEEGDLHAVLAPAAARTADGILDHDAVAAMIERMVEERIAAMLATGQLVAGVPGGAPTGRLAEGSPTPPMTPRRPAEGSRSEAQPSRRRQPTVTSRQAMPRGETSSAGVEAAQRPEQGANPSHPSLRPIDRPAKTSPQLQTQSPPPPPPRTAGPRLDRTSAPDTSAPPSKVAAAMWERIPTLVDGQAGLLKAQNLDHDAISLLVMINGTTSLNGLRTLVPQLDDTRFLSIIRDAVKQGVISLS